ncbi:MAG: DMT family transporter [Candidatus Moduliflexus flocculans]|nr:DMT family transporter [Candidatus Moduliflexus flocculans]
MPTAIDASARLLDVLSHARIRSPRPLATARSWPWLRASPGPSPSMLFRDQRPPHPPHRPQPGQEPPGPGPHRADAARPGRAALRRPSPPRTVALLLLSGVLGIAVSDTLFFHALNRLGASLTAIVDCFYSPFVIALSFFLLGERLCPHPARSAPALVVSAVLTPVQGRQDREDRPRRDLVLGIVYGILAMFFVAFGIVMVKPVLGGDLGVLGDLRPHRRRRRRARRPRPLPPEPAGHPRAPLRPPQLEGPRPGVLLRLLPLAHPVDGRHEVRQGLGRLRPQPAQHDLHRHHRGDLPQGKADGLEAAGGRPGLPRGLPGLDAVLTEWGHDPFPRNGIASPIRNRKIGD